MTTADLLPVVQALTLAETASRRSTLTDPSYPCCVSCPLWLVLRSIRTEIRPERPGPVVLHSIRTLGLPELETRNSSEPGHDTVATGGVALAAADEGVCRDRQRRCRHLGFDRQTLTGRPAATGRFRSRIKRQR